jgi:hypothetical protein
MALLTGILHSQIKGMDPKSGHRGYDIAIKPNSRRKGAMVEANDFEFICNGTRMGSPTYDAKRVLELFTEVINKYFNKQREALREVNKEVTKSVNKEIRRDIPGGQILKAIVQTTDGEYEVRTNGEASPELNEIVNKLINVHATAGLAMKQQLHRCTERLRVGTLDISEDGTRLVTWNKDGTTSPVTGRVSLDTLKATLWFITGMYKNAPSVRKFFVAEASQGKYTCRFNKGIVSFDTEGLSNTEKTVISDIALLDKAGELAA